MKEGSREFGIDELREYDGDEGRPAYIALNGKVYDVSESGFWKNGLHMNRHRAGFDLSKELKLAPHYTEVFKHIKQIGILTDDCDISQKQLPNRLIDIMENYPIIKRHPHPVAAHFPIAFSFLVPVFCLLSLITGKKSYEQTSFYLLIACAIAAPVAIATGVLSWLINYGAKRTRPIKVKILTSAIYFCVLVSMLRRRIKSDEVMNSAGKLRRRYILESFSLPILTGLIGYHGAKMTFPH